MNKLVRSNRNKTLDRGAPITPKETFKLDQKKTELKTVEYTPKPASMKIDSELRDKINALSLIGIGENQKEVVSRALSSLVDSLTEEQQRTFKNQFEVLRKRTMEREK
ncbi:MULTISPECIES: DUF5388 domain-containing protein [Enterococcus]|uniref:DUF5388 domain-containing protein n=1 Tax=Enterococcus TaxID=1350 RepID=UPI000A330D26|nr:MULTISPECIES: DUF5388 domain-containing protein [Enterococcus]MDG4581562.1 DUF5388 domain-containing protein [Enterococcus faecium]MDT2325837.1 DUF5388 domain-containing protein [Enterococcus faecium]OTO71528.1 hypothetical protein A5840_002629 [Enterococcus faecium]OTO78151.1 hypothetical protein A5855_002649 [Enterococcus faecium]ROZ09836.1 hypothetical protein EGX06_12935 [Enterococcus hirae]